MKLVQSFFLYTVCVSAVWGQSPSDHSRNKEVVVLAGMIQPFLLQGGNFEVDLYTPKMVFNYSHGFSLDMNKAGNTTVGEMKSQSLALHLPYSTGFGIGYRLNNYFDLRFEPKMHKYEVYYDETDRHQVENKIANYRTVTLGGGVYFRWKPFENDRSFLRGITTSTSIRYWQNVWTSLPGEKISYSNRVTGKVEAHRAANIGIANTPIIFNIAIGYGFRL